jgi:7,8-dihydropterin-6-yl-methyl-4-(beta-D-ribofuranosyl)aminobenzene 5'-phosphate synthase
MKMEKKQTDLLVLPTRKNIWNRWVPTLFSIRILQNLTSFEKPDPTLFTEIDGKTNLDMFPDDQSLILDTQKGLILIFGCAHSGMINIINYVIDKTGKDKFYAILGGTHLDFLTPEQLDESIKVLKKMKIEKIGVCHCTGMRAAFRLHQEFGDRFFYGHVGSGLEV